MAAAFHVTPTALGALVGIQYLIYMALQLPAGIIGGRWHPVRLLLAGMGVDAAGTFVTGLAPQYGWVLVGRVLVGLGDAFIFITLVAVLGRWYRASEFGGAVGWLGSGGQVGALLATFPLAWLVGAAGWQSAFWASGAMILVVMGIVWLTLARWPLPGGNRNPGMKSGRKESVRQSLGRILRTRAAWPPALCHFGVLGPFLGFASVFLVPYIMVTHHVTRPVAGQLEAFAWVAAALGGPLTGFVSDRIGRRIPYLGVAAMAVSGWLALMFWAPGMPTALLPALFFWLGYTSGGAQITFAAVRDRFQGPDAALASGLANMFGFFSAVLVPIGMGMVMGHRLDDVAAYRWALGVPLICSLAGLAGAWALPRRPRCPAPARSLGTRV